MHPYVEYVNPYLGKTITEIGLDKKFVRGIGSYLYDEQGREYLDCIAAYGALPFGHNPHKIWEAITSVHTSGEPTFVQPSLLDAAGELAKRLIEVAPPGLAHVTFTNSGAEAVEAAFKLCRAKTGRNIIVSTKNSFHGKTLGALSATGNNGYQDAFGAPVPGFVHIPYGNIQVLRDFLKEHSQEVAAFIIEPIQGEGGIVEPPTGYLAAVKQTCAEFGVLTIFDEIQTGLGRTGTLFGCEHEGVTPDVLVLAKALGGGVFPIGAVLCTSDVYTEEFGNKHSSTFAGNAVGCRVGLKVLEMLTKNNQELVKEVAAKGTLLKSKLVEVAQAYPQVLQSVRGEGLMLGLDFGTDRSVYPHSLLGVMAEQELLTPMISSYLLNTEGIRVAPTLNGASVVRVEPPLTITEEQIEQVVAAVARTVAMLAEGNTASCLGHLIGYNSSQTDKHYRNTKAHINPTPQDDDGRFAFLVHPVDLSNYHEFDESLSVFSTEQLEDLSSRWNDMVEPFVVSGVRIKSPTGKTAFGEFICVPRTAEQLLAMDKEQAIKEIQAAVDLATSRGAKIVGLGAYTSVVTMGGRSLIPHVEVPITTGNSYTVVSGVESLLAAAKKLELDLSRTTAAMVGAGGAIGKALSTLLAENVQELILVGNPGRPDKSMFRMAKVAVQIVQHLRMLGHRGHVFPENTLGAYACALQDTPDNEASIGEWTEYVEKLIATGFPITLTTNSKKVLPRADIILAATSSTEALIEPSMLKWGAVVCDMSRPLNVSRDVLQQRPDVLIIDGGVVEVPNRPDLGWNFGFEEGTAYACMSETLMLALEKRYENASIGADLNLEFLEVVQKLAVKHGFKLAGLRNFDKPLDEAAIEEVKNLRSGLPNAQEA